ncbi:MAG: YHS domain-containing (seleno)protein [Alphaproteobacteria bacterium]|uniref:YHS domain-containing (seleno)protein n=1 Tax=Pacificispira sp. TaxID=2888761 RepID=UPI001B0A9B83|nr:YHS domain-containing protein [Alphaproteobacteria bacterium]MBO6860990.1 YHS domain-containing protein [Alphaproteobacteria bacterium]MEC9267217.1 YHS domain-containing (seleno)protein [Pseudomonadota bacterium]
MKSVASLLAGAFVSLFVAASAMAAGVELNTSQTGLALQGYDPVAYFTEGKPVQGNWQITSQYQGATYRFANEAHKDKFEADPAAYVPQYGGYCAFGTAMGFKFDGDPTQWRIVDDKLYLNLSAEIQEKWLADVPGYIDQADGKWVDIATKSPAELQQ